MKRPLGLALTIIMILMAIEVATKKPLCINSNIVYKIDRLSKAPSEEPIALMKSRGAGTYDSIYSCRALKAVGLSRYFYQNRDSIERRLIKLELLLGYLGFNGNVEVSIDPVALDRLEFYGNKILIGEKKFNNRSLETAIAQTLIKKSGQTKNKQQITFLAEIMTQNFSAESIFSELWKNTLDHLSLIEKFKFNSIILQDLRNRKIYADSSMTEFILNLLSSDNRVIQEFKNEITQKFKNVGLLPNDLNFDLVIQSEVTLNTTTFERLSKKNSSMRVVYEDRTGAYILPTMIRISEADVKKIKSNLRIFLLNQAISKINFSDYFENTEKLIVVNTNDKLDQLNLAQLFQNNSKSFLKSNSNFDFIQFHIPSYKFRFSKTMPTSNFFKFLKQNSLTEFKMKSLGWSSQSWASDVQAYKPVALYDIVQYYRIN